MSLQVGYIDNDGHPKIKIRVQGTIPGVSIDIDAMIDTGFTGFLMLPVAQALPLGLVLIGTGDYALADGGLVTTFLARGQIVVGTCVVKHPKSPNIAPGLIEDETVDGLIVLAGDEPLVGMDFMKGLDKLLIVGKTVMLIDNSTIKLPDPAMEDTNPSLSGPVAS